MSTANFILTYLGHTFDFLYIIKNHSSGMEEVAVAYFQFREQYIDVLLLLIYEKYNYEFSIKLAGFWKTTIIWCEVTPRKTPEEMAKLITSLLAYMSSR